MPFSPLPRVPGGYSVILADPPWSFATYDKPIEGTTPHRTAEEPYKVLTLDLLKTLPVADITAPDCVLLLWVVDSHLELSFSLARAWGFEYKTRAFEWIKPGIGMGFWTRKQCESVLLFTRGKPHRISKSVRQAIDSRRQAHSQKPEEIYERTEALLPGPYCELFARRRRIGWHSWGDQLPPNAEESRSTMSANLSSMVFDRQLGWMVFSAVE